MTTAFPNPPAPGTPSPLAEHDALPAGTRFGEFEIVRVLGVGGFGIVYLAQDHSLERLVALKEYMPASLAARGVGPAITVRSGSFAETYAVGLRSFINEARLLARFDHPSLVKVYRFWEDNATAYMVMPYLQGITLRDLRRTMTESPDETWIRHVMMPMLSALELLHREGVYHRDIAPDNILLPPEAQPILLDFGAARRVISDRTQSLTAILKPSYAPIEQYAEMTQLRQGPWTDLYALGAVMHFLLFGQPPAPATARAVQDKQEGLEQRLVPGVSPRFLAIVGWMLAVRPNERPQSVEALRAALDGRAPVPEPLRRDVTVPGDTALMSVAPTPFQKTLLVDPRYAAPTQIDHAHRPTEVDHTQRLAAAPAPAPLPTPRRDAGGERPKTGLVVGALVAAAGVALAVFWFVAGDRRAPLAVSDAASAALAPVLASAPVGAASAPAEVLPNVALVPSPEPLPASSPAASPPVASEAAVTAVDGTSAASAATANAAAASAAKARQVARAAARASDAAAKVQRAAMVAATPPVAASPPAIVALPPAELTVITRPPAAPSEPATAREACGGRVFIALALCMDRECEKPRYRENAECTKVLEMKRRREQQ